MRAFGALIGRDLALAFRAGGGAWPSLVFFALVILDFALAIGPDLAALSRIAAPLLWANALFGVLVSIDRIFQADLDDGSLEIMIETSEFLSLSVLAKAFAHWLATGLPLTLAAGALGLLLGLPASAYGPLLLSLLLGTPALTLIALVSAAATATIKRAGVLASLLAAPLYTPVIIFGVAAAEAGAAGGVEFRSSLFRLAAISLFALIIAPLAAAAALRSNLT